MAPCGKRSPSPSSHDARVSLGPSKTGVVISPDTPLNHTYILSLPATPSVQALAAARIQRQAEGPQGWRGGRGEKARLSLIVCAEAEKTDPGADASRL